MAESDRSLLIQCTDVIGDVMENVLVRGIIEAC